MILSTITAILLIVIVLLQNSKGGGLDSSFGNVNQLGGVAQSTETIEKDAKLQLEDIESD